MRQSPLEASGVSGRLGVECRIAPHALRRRRNDLASRVVGLCVQAVDTKRHTCAQHQQRGDASTRAQHSPRGGSGSTKVGPNDVPQTGAPGVLRDEAAALEERFSNGGWHGTEAHRREAQQRVSAGVMLGRGEARDERQNKQGRHANESGGGSHSPQWNVKRGGVRELRSDGTVGARCGRLLRYQGARRGARILVPPPRIPDRLTSRAWSPPLGSRELGSTMKDPRRGTVAAAAHPEEGERIRRHRRRVRDARSARIADQERSVDS